MQKNNIPEKWGNTDVSNPWGNKDSVNAEKAGGVSSNSGISLDKAGSVQNHVSETPDINGGRAVIEEPHDSVQSFEAVNPESTGSANTMKVLRVALASVMVAALLGTPLVFWLMNRQGSNDFEADNSVVENNSNNNATYNFYQTNNSPKALSRYDIYRDTQKQISLMRQVLRNA